MKYKSSTFTDTDMRIQKDFEFYEASMSVQNPESFQIGDEVRVFLNANTFGQEGWFTGVVVQIEPYSAHRSFYWVELDEESRAILGKGIKLISVLNPKNIEKKSVE